PPDQAGRSPGADEPVNSRVVVATAYLPLPRLQSGSVDPATGPVPPGSAPTPSGAVPTPSGAVPTPPGAVPTPPGAVPTPPGAPQDRLSSLHDMEQAGAERATDVRPRRRFGRRAHRSRYGRGWGRRHGFRFPF